MKYSEYIELGFERIEMNDSVEQKNNGYGGYKKKKRLTDRITLEAYWNELQAPKMYIKKQNSETYHILNITPEIVKDLVSDKMPNYLGHA